VDSNRRSLQERNERSVARIEIISHAIEFLDYDDVGEGVTEQAAQRGLEAWDGLRDLYGAFPVK
jgi:hypothetical protein